MFDRLLLPDLRLMIESNEDQGMAEFCKALHPAVVAEVLEGLAVEDSWRVLQTCDTERQAEIFEFLSLPYQMETVTGVERSQLSKLIETMAPDDRVDLLERMDSESVESLLPLIAQAERSDIRKLLSFPEDSAGSIMTTEYASLPEDITIAEALTRVRQQAPHRETIYYVYILDEGRRLRGLISLVEIILANPESKLTDCMQHDVISVRVDDDQEIVANEIARYDFIAMPVVDKQNRLVGIVTYDDVFDIVQEEATEDAHLSAAVAPLEDSYMHTSLMTIAWKRGIWLVILLVAAFATAAVMSAYDSISDGYRWMILFIPLILASGGNAGSQSATLIIRAIATGDVTHKDTLKIAKRELIMACLLGTVLMLLGFVSAIFFEDFKPACVVAVTVFLVVLIGTVTGAMLPILFKRLGMDPALMSNPLIAALVDVLGVVIYFTVAILMLGRPE